MAASRLANTGLRNALAEAGWTLHELARAVNAAGAEGGMRLRYDRTSVSPWLAGTRPRPAVRLLIAEVLSRRLGRALAPEDCGFDTGGPGAVVTAHIPGDADATVRRFAELCRGDVVLRPAPSEPLPVGTSPVPVWSGLPAPAVLPETGPGDPAIEALDGPNSCCGTPRSTRRSSRSAPFSTCTDGSTRPRPMTPAVNAGPCCTRCGARRPRGRSWRKWTAP
ncbi:hypothetical protein ACFYXF_13995 [Streptomyces sp. NPDC002680]|uniref:hypothetical protein n=1 Tax=Streptomyces sp. NPDC002680 TaxID=3364659 RepID=UPI00368E4F93